MKDRPPPLTILKNSVPGVKHDAVIHSAATIAS